VKSLLQILLFIFLVLQFAFAVEPPKSSAIILLKENPSSQLLVQSIPEAREFKDRALTTFVARKLARDYPFSPSALEFLNAARAQSPESLKNFKGGDFWFLPLSFIRILVLAAGVLMVLNFELRSFRTFLFLFLAFGLIIGEGINLSQGLFPPVFIPFEGDHFALSAPEVSEQAVEKLVPGTEIMISEIVGDWLKLELPSGRVGWILSKDGIVESED
jgi:hypothetical protein